MPHDDAILETRHLTTVLGGRGGVLRPRHRSIRAVDDVTLTIRRGETLGLVGESGCGKTTLARTILGLQRETSGEIWLEGQRVDGHATVAARRMRQTVQYLHQDAAGSLDPWWSVGKSLEEAIRLNGKTEGSRPSIDAILEAVGLDRAIRQSYPHELSGGQSRRVALARLMSLEPKVVILDEPTAGLDLSVQSSVLRLLIDVKERFQLTNIFISHDLAVVKLICDHVAVMYCGRIVELAPAKTLFAMQRHPYTRALLQATPRLEEHQTITLSDHVTTPSPDRDLAGCAFQLRCPHVAEICRSQRPDLETTGDAALVACHRWADLGPSFLEK